MVIMKQLEVPLAGLFFFGILLAGSYAIHQRPASARSGQAKKDEAANRNGQKESPFVCNIAAMNAAERKRKAALDDELRSLGLEVRELPGGYAFRFPGDASTFQTVAEWTALERLCCPFFSFDLELEREGGPLWLRLTGREGVERFIQLEFGLREGQQAR